MRFPLTTTSRSFATIAACCLLMGQAPAAESLVHVTPDGIAMTVTADGLSHVSLAEKTIAQGGWYAWNAAPAWFGIGEKEVLAYGGYSKGLYAKVADDIEEKSIEILSKTHATVRHQQANATTTYEYKFAGEDVTIVARIENNHPSAVLDMPAFGGLQFEFANPPEGNMPVWHTSYLAHTGVGVFHPSQLNKIGGSYATDGRIGIGVSPLARGIARSLLFWDYDNWAADARENVPVRWLSYIRPKPIEPGGALTFQMKLRVSKQTDWRHLLAPYKEHFRSTFGKRQYRADDHRLVTVAHVNRDRQAITSENPYGFHGGFRRLDLEKGMTELCDLLIPALKTAGGQGVIFWGQGGQNSRGAMYRSDFDILPPEVDKNWHILADRFKKANLKLGVCTRPRHLTVREDWTTDRVIDINADDPNHMKLLTGRFEKMIDRGCTMFYLDSFGGSLEDVKTMRHLRNAIGPEIQTYAEHACDALLAYSGIYTETDYYEKGTTSWAKENCYVPRTGLKLQEFGRWLLGDIPCISRRYDIRGTIPEDFESPEQFFYRNRMTPMIADYVIPRTAEQLGELQRKYIDDKGMWQERIDD